MVKVARDGESLAAQRDAHRAVNHPGVAPCIDADVAGAWIALPYLSGGPVDAWARGQPLAVVIEAAACLAEAVEHLHGRGMIHGDLKPANVLMNEEGRPVLVDLGDAGAGTPGWRGPEVEQGGRPTSEGDVFALGAVIYAMVTGRPPFAEPEGYGRTRLPEPPSSIRPGLPAPVEEAILAMLHPSPASRPRRGLALGLRAGAAAPPRPDVVVGMTREREALRRAVAEAHHGVPRIVVVHGPPGSGRRTLLREALGHAERMGFELLTEATPEALASLRRRAVVALDGTALATEELALTLFRSGTPDLILISAGHPLPAVARAGGWHLRPGPLTLDDLAVLLEATGRDRRTAEALRRRSRGHPGTVRRLLGAEGAAPPAPDPALDTLLAVLRGGPVTVPRLAERAGLSEHRLLDLLEPALDEGIVASSPDGLSLSLARPQREFR